MMWHGFLRAFGLVFCLFLVQPAFADPSFDCRKAATMVDRLVCADPELARADQQMAWAYADALKFAPGRRVGLISDQRAWLAGRVTFEARKQSYDTCFITAPSALTPDERLCLKQHYKERRDQLLRDVFVEPDTLVGDHADYARLMSHGEALLLGAVEVRCTPDRVQIFFGSTREGLKDIYGRGDREARWIDCPIGGGHRIRFKIGDQFPPQPYGECGASPAQIFSVWRDRRKLIEARDAGEECFGWKLHSATVTATGVETCAAVGKPEWLIEPGKPGRKAAPKKGPCVTSKVEGTRDKAAFSDLPPDILIAQPSKELGALCGRFINPKDLTKVAVPADVRRPAWVSAGPGRHHADFSKLGFNATSLAASMNPESATFDLLNTGRVVKVYHVEEENHWFDGSAFAVDRPGIITTPFDAHNWDRSVRSGIYPFVYLHATIFFANGRTYLLGEPSLSIADAGVLRLEASGKLIAACTLKRRQEHF